MSASSSYIYVPVSFSSRSIVSSTIAVLGYFVNYQAGQNAGDIEEESVIITQGSSNRRLEHAIEEEIFLHPDARPSLHGACGIEIVVEVWIRSPAVAYRRTCQAMDAGGLGCIRLSRSSITKYNTGQRVRQHLSRFQMSQAARSHAGSNRAFRALFEQGRLSLPLLPCSRKCYADSD